MRQERPAGWGVGGGNLPPRATQSPLVSPRRGGSFEEAQDSLTTGVGGGASAELRAGATSRGPPGVPEQARPPPFAGSVTCQAF